jgi:hypothetical protein
MRAVSTRLKVFTYLSVSVVLCLLIVLMTAPALKRSLTNNIAAVALLSATPYSSAPSDYRYGAGLRLLSDEEARTIFWYTFGSSPPKSSCLPETGTFESTTDFPPNWKVDETVSPIRSLLAIRRLECAENSTAALRTLNSVPASPKIDMLRAGLLRRLGRKNEAFAIALPYLCPSDSEWCSWCLSNAFPDEMPHEIDDYRLGGLPGSSNESEHDRADQNLRALSPLYHKDSQNVTREFLAPSMITNTVPLMVTNAIPRAQGDNYVEYTTVPVQDPLVRFRVKGAVLGESPASCLVPRLVFWSSDAYLGETMHPYEVTGRFEVDLWSTLPEQTTMVTPRLTFDSTCFAERQRIVICHVGLAETH